MATASGVKQIVNIYEAKTQLSKLVDLAASGTDVVIARAGKPVARLTALKAEKRPIVFGLLEGQGWIADDFNAPLPEDLQAAFEGR
ncbi:MAG: type II toxin-antitoxin system prevent-host-death family antitoxin [Terracidiphilus sp.]|jgi:prevent-host-death family protein